MLPVQSKLAVRFDMSISAVSLYRGGSEEAVTALSKRMKAVLLKHGVGYDVGRVRTHLEGAEWLVTVRYADSSAYEAALENFSRDPEHAALVAEIGRIVTLVRRELIEELVL